MCLRHKSFAGIQLLDIIGHRWQSEDVESTVQLPPPVKNDDNKQEKETQNHSHRDRYGDVRVTIYGFLRP